MGKMVLMLVLAASFGSSLLLSSSRRAAFDAARATVNVQADVLARELAASAGRLVVGRAVLNGSFRSAAPFTNLDFDGGEITLDAYNASSTSLAFTVTARHTGATHRLQSNYAWAENDFPGPLWLDAPYANVDIDPSSKILGGADNRPTYFDSTKFQELRLADLVSFPDMQSQLTSGLEDAGSQLAVPPAMSTILQQHYTPALETIYYDATDALGKGTVGRGDITVRGPNTGRNPFVLPTDAQVGSAAEPAIVRVVGGLTIPAGKRLEGNGMLLVEGPLTVAADTVSGDHGALDWDGIVLVRTDLDYLPVDLSGDVDVLGAVLVDQLGAPPGGHLDVTVVRDHSGAWDEAYGTDLVTYGNRPWHRHTHKFDEETGGKVVYFYVNGGPGLHDRGSGKHRTRFYDTIDYIDDQNGKVVLEFGNIQSAHGLARLYLDIQGEDIHDGSIQQGLPEALNDGTPYRTKAFNPDDLRTFALEIRSLRLLKQAFDEIDCPAYFTTTQCNERPQGISSYFDRDGSLTVRVLHEPSDGGPAIPVYESMMYWHMRQDEAGEDNAEEEEWRRRIRDGEVFGAQITSGAPAQILFSLDAIEPIARRLSYFTPQLIHRGSWSEHWSAGDSDAPTL